MKFIIILLLCFQFMCVFNGCLPSHSQVIKTDNGGVFEVKTVGSYLLIMNNGKPLVGIIESGKSQYIETFANGVTSLNLGYKKNEYEPTSMLLALGDPMSPRVIIYDSSGHVKQEISDVNQFLEDNAEKLKQMQIEEQKLLETLSKN